MYSGFLVGGGCGSVLWQFDNATCYALKLTNVLATLSNDSANLKCHERNVKLST